MSKNLVFPMSAQEVAEYIIFYFGRIKLEILKYVVDEIGLTRIAKAADVSTGSISSALSRESLGDDLAFRIFKGLAERYPELLKTAIDKALRKHADGLDKISNNLAELIKKKILG